MRKGKMEVLQCMSQQVMNGCDKAVVLLPLPKGTHCSVQMP